MHVWYLCSFMLFWYTCGHSLDPFFPLPLTHAHSVLIELCSQLSQTRDAGQVTVNTTGKIVFLWVNIQPKSLSLCRNCYRWQLKLQMDQKCFVYWDHMGKNKIIGCILILSLLLSLPSLSLSLSLSLLSLEYFNLLSLLFHSHVELLLLRLVHWLIRLLHPTSTF